MDKERENIAFDEGNEQNADISKLLSNAEEVNEAVFEKEKQENDIKTESENTVKQEVVSENENKKPKIFEKYKIKDIVFLAIMSACMLITGGVMPLLAQVPLFGIIQVGMGLQFSIFPVIGLMKTRKVGALMFMSLFCGVVMVFMNPIMFAIIVIIALVIELLMILIFRGYHKDLACFLAGSLYMPLTLPLMFLYYKVMYTGEIKGQAVSAFVTIDNPWIVIGMTAAVIAVCALGSFLGIIISRELKKSGVLKK